MKGLRSLIFGAHNPIVHGFFVAMAWRRIYRENPSFKELVCIMFHDIGYINQTFVEGDGDRHPELGARICGRIFGEEYYRLCITHSRDYAKKLGQPLSKLGYADKYSVLLIPNIIYKPLLYLGGEAQEYHQTTKTRKWGYPIQTELIKADYRMWWTKNVGTTLIFQAH